VEVGIATHLTRTTTLPLYTLAHDHIPSNPTICVLYSNSGQNFPNAVSQHSSIIINFFVTGGMRANKNLTILPPSFIGFVTSGSRVNSRYQIQQLICLKLFLDDPSGPSLVRVSFSLDPHSLGLAPTLLGFSLFLDLPFDSSCPYWLHAS